MGDGRDYDPTKFYWEDRHGFRPQFEGHMKNFLLQSQSGEAKKLMQRVVKEAAKEIGLSRPPFEVGDIVKLKTGDSPQRVLSIRETPSGWSIRAVYLSSEHYLDHSGEPVSATWKRSERFEHHELHKQQKQENAMNTLYQTVAKAGEVIEFGTFLARNSLGQLVLEMKGSGQVKTFDSKEVEIVRPYTVRVRFINDTNKTRGYDYIAVKGSVEVGDLILQKDTGQMVRVTMLDSKASGSLKTLCGRKLVTEDLEEADIGETVIPVEGDYDGEEL